MKLATFRVTGPEGSVERVGLIDGQQIWDATNLFVAAHESNRTRSRARGLAGVEAPADLVNLVSEEGAIERLAMAQQAAVDSGRSQTLDGAPLLLDLADVELLAPIPRPPGIACFTVWRSHIEDSAAKGFAVAMPAAGSEMHGYYKATPETTIGPGKPVVWPWYTQEFDVECELAAVVGRSVKDASPDEAESAILGYMIFNDFSARDVQRQEMELGLGPAKGKDMDGGNAFGPYITTRDEVDDVRDLTLSLHVNGEEWSSCSAKAMEATFGELLSYLSRGHTVPAGQILTSGCYPGGSGLDTGRTIAVGDEVELRISGLGSLSNTVVADPVTTRPW